MPLSYVTYGSAASERFAVRTVTADEEGEPITPGFVEPVDDDTGERWSLDAAAAFRLADLLTEAARRVGGTR